MGFLFKVGGMDIIKYYRRYLNDLLLTRKTLNVLALNLTYIVKDFNIQLLRGNKYKLNFIIDWNTFSNWLINLNSTYDFELYHILLILINLYNCKFIYNLILSLKFKTQYSYMKKQNKNTCMDLLKIKLKLNF